MWEEEAWQRERKGGPWLERRGERGEPMSEVMGGVTVSPASVLAPPRPIEIDQRPDKRFRQGLLRVLLQQEGRRTSNRFPHSLSGVVVSRFLTRVRAGEGPGVGLQGVQTVCPPLTGALCRGLAR